MPTPSAQEPREEAPEVFTKEGPEPQKLQQASMVDPEITLSGGAAQESPPQNITVQGNATFNVYYGSKAGQEGDHCKKEKGSGNYGLKTRRNCLEANSRSGAEKTFCHG